MRSVTPFFRNHQFELIFHNIFPRAGLSEECQAKNGRPRQLFLRTGGSTLGSEKLSQQNLGTGRTREEQEFLQSGSSHSRSGRTERAGARTQVCPRDGQDARGDPTSDAASCSGGWEEVDDSRRGGRRRGRKKIRRGGGKVGKTTTYRYMITI